MTAQEAAVLSVKKSDKELEDFLSVVKRFAELGRRDMSYTASGLKQETIEKVKALGYSVSEKQADWRDGDYYNISW